MEPQAIDAGEFRAAQHRHWDSAGAGWMQWSLFNDRADAHISERLVQLADVQPGSRVLDVAAGYGEPALTAARKAGPEGRVVATDISAEMLAFGRERVAAAGLENVEFIESGAPIRAMIEQHGGEAQQAAWDAITRAVADASGRSTPLTLSNAVLLALGNRITPETPRPRWLG